MPIFGYRPIKREDDDDPEPNEGPDLLDAEQTWRFEKFDELGFNVFSCFILAVKAADWQKAEKLLKLNPDHDWVFDQLA